VLDLVDESSDVREQLDGKLIPGLDKFLGCPGSTNTGRGAGQNDGTSEQSSALGEEADQLRDVENQVTKEVVISF